MNNKILAGVVVALIAGVGVFLSTNNSDDVAESPASSVQQPSSLTTPSDTATQPSASTANAGTDRYVTFSETAIADAKDTKRVVFFHADWCSTCNAFQKEINSEGVPEGITIIKANYDREIELKKQYGVSVQSTFVLLDENENAVKSWPFGQGLSGISDLYEQVASL